MKKTLQERKISIMIKLLEDMTSKKVVLKEESKTWYVQKTEIQQKKGAQAEEMSKKVFDFLTKINPPYFKITKVFKPEYDYHSAGDGFQKSFTIRVETDLDNRRTGSKYPERGYYKMKGSIVCVADKIRAEVDFFRTEWTTDIEFCVKSLIYCILVQGYSHEKIWLNKFDSEKEKAINDISLT